MRDHITAELWKSGSVASECLAWGALYKTSCCEAGPSPDTWIHRAPPSGPAGMSRLLNASPSQQVHLALLISCSVQLTLSPSRYLSLSLASSFSLSLLLPPALSLLLPLSLVLSFQPPIVFELLIQTLFNKRNCHVVTCVME